MPKQGEIQLVISAVSTQAKKELDKLSAQYNKLVDEQNKLTEGTADYAKKAAEIDKVREKMSSLAKQIESGNINSLDRLTKAEKAAERELKGLVEGTEEYIKVSKRLEAVRAEKSKVKQSIADIGTELDKTKSKFSLFAGGVGDSLKGLAPLGAAAIGAFAVEKIIEFGAGAIAAFNEAENAAFGMHNALVVLGGESEETFQRLMDQSDALEAATVGFSAEMIQTVQKDLKVFDLTGAEIEKLTPKILDYATATGKDLASATDDVTNAMMGKTKALEKVGIHLDKSQISVQGVTDSLDKFKGSAAAALEVGTNKMEVLGDKWGKIEEAVGGFLVNAGFQLVEWFTPVVQGLADIWAAVSRAYEAFDNAVAPIRTWFGELAKSYPWLGKVKEAISYLTTPFAALGATLGMVGTAYKMTVAGAIAGVKTMKEVWGNLADYAANIFGNLGSVMKDVFLGDWGNIGSSIDKLKTSLSTAGGEIAGSFVKNYEAEMAKFKAVPEAATPLAPIKDRKIKSGKDEDAEAAAGAKAGEEAKKAQDKADAEADKAAQKKIEQDKKADEERIKFRKEYIDRTLAADKAAEDTRISLMQAGLEKEQALLRQKHDEEEAKLKALEKDLNENTAISAEERQALQDKYDLQRKAAAEKLTKDLTTLEVQHANDVNKAISEAEDKKQERANTTAKALADIAILGAKTDDDLLHAKIQKIITEREIELQNAELTATGKTLIREKAAKDIETLENEAAAKLKAIKDKETADAKTAADKQVSDRKAMTDAIVGIANGGLQALVEFSQIETDKKSAAYEKDKDARIKALDAQLAKGRISEKNYAKAKEKIEADAHDKIAAIKTEQAKKDKAAAIIQAAINTAVAVTAGMATPAVPPFPSAIAAGILGALNIALIAAKPLPTFAKGGIATGASHNYGGIKLFDTASRQVVGEMEGGEPYMILSKSTYGNNKEVIDRLLYSSTRLNGAKIFDKGGILSRTPVTIVPGTQAASASRGEVDFSGLIAEIRALRMDVQQQRSQLQAYITFNSIEDSMDEVNAIRKKAGK